MARGGNRPLGGSMRRIEACIALLGPGAEKKLAQAGLSLRQARRMKDRKRLPLLLSESVRQRAIDVLQRAATYARQQAERADDELRALRMAEMAQRIEARRVAGRAAPAAGADRPAERSRDALVSEPK